MLCKTNAEQVASFSLKFIVSGCPSKRKSNVLHRYTLDVMHVLNCVRDEFPILHIAKPKVGNKLHTYVHCCHQNISDAVNSISS